MIDIKFTVARLQALTQDALKVVLSAALLSLLLAGVSMIGLILHNLSLRETELRIQRVLGTSSSRISWLWTAEYFSVSFLAALTSGVLSCLVSFGICFYLFDLTYTPNLPGLFGVIAVLCLASVVMARWALRILNRPLVSRRASS